MLFRSHGESGRGHVFCLNRRRSAEAHTPWTLGEGNDDRVTRIEIAREPFDAARIHAVAFDAYDTLFDWDFTATIAAYLAEARIECDHEAFASYFRKDAFQAVSLWAPGHRAEDGTLDRRKMLDGPTPEWISTWEIDRKSTRLNSSHMSESRMPSSA